MIKFKHEWLKNEFNNSIHPRLRVIVYAIAGFCEYEFNKNLTITEILRTQATQDIYYKDSPAYQRKPWKSVHQYGKGVDCRSFDFSMKEIKRIDEFVDKHFVYDKRRRESSIYHSVGHGNHLHFQVWGDWKSWR